MPSLKTEHGRMWSVNRIVNGDSYPELTDIAVGTGTTDPTESDTQLESEEYRTTFSDANANIYVVSGGTGAYRVNVTLSGGTEVLADTSVSEFGIFDANGDLVYRETRSPTTIASGERISFEIEIQLTNV